MAIVIDNPALERRFKRRAAKEGITEVELIERLLQVSEPGEARPSVEEVAAMFAHNRGVRSPTKQESDDLFEPLG
ncbi:hypothetical protein EON79_01320 [bacterium]|nr:MAG: hypothetical protein EON79_01320 [bacterium]